jgi:hypothetical protein
MMDEPPCVLLADTPCYRALIARNSSIVLQSQDNKPTRLEDGKAMTAAEERTWTHHAELPKLSP